ncbi:MAG: hypothetical protein LAT64_05560 [Phycisphaerales bacterium]|nr:hypothetical protein [Planctomycetota bacterium]MCH8508223.1 hypothetical protein [Phycisphaerales bacterium]
MKPMRWIWGMVLLVVPHAAAQPMEILYDDLDPQLKAEVKVFISMYTHLLIHGEPAEGADAFSFTHPHANSPLFQPYVAYVRTLAKIKAGDDFYFGHLVGPAEVAAYSDGTLVSTSITDAMSTLNHLSAISASAGTTHVSTVDGELNSTGLGVEPAEGGEAYVSPLDPPSYEDWMADLASLAASVSATLDPAMDVRYMLLGEPTNAERMRAQLDAWLQVERSGDTGLGSYVIHAAFGKFGALPIIVIIYSDGYLLVDGMNGTVAGPYLYEDEIDAVSLLSLRAEYSAGTGVAGININTSTWAVEVSKWLPRHPQHYVANPACPGNPGCWIPRLATGKPYYGCKPHPRGGCECEAKGTYVPGPNAPPGSPPFVETRIVCRLPAGPGGEGDCPDNFTEPPNHISAPANCRQEWFHLR